MNTQENNRLIAEFMGMVYDNHNDQPNKYWELTDEQNFVSQKPYPQDKDLKFHSDWNWLMPVVIECFNKHESVSDDFNFKLNDALLETNIESLYKAVVEFIVWFNSQSF